MLILYILLLLASFALLAKICDEYFVQSLEMLSEKFKLNDDVAGATFMAIGSSAPEFFTASIALMTVWSEMVWAWTIVWSALFNVLVIIGASATVMTGALKRPPLVRDLLFYVWSLLILYVTFIDGTITLIETILYLVSYVVYIGILNQRWKRYPREDFSVAESIAEHEEIAKERRWIIWKFMHLVDTTLDRLFPNLNKHPKYVRWSFGLSVLWIAVLSRILVESSVELAHILWIPEVVIWLTVLAAWTSVPDLISSIIVSKKWQLDMAVSNAIWSNIFDVFIGLWLPRCVYIMITGQVVVTDTWGLGWSILILLLSVILLLVMLYLARFRLNSKIWRTLVALYIAYVVYQVVLVYV